MGRLGHAGSSIPLTRELFPTGFAGEVMHLICETWNSFSLGKSIVQETRITALFSDALIAAYEAAGRGGFIMLEAPVVDPVSGTEEGRNDLTFFPLGRFKQKVFFTVECKRLRVRRPSGFVHLANEYVDQGMQRFVDEKYSKGLPCGGMIGYVMDGNVDEAFKRVCIEIEKRIRELKMRTSHPLQKPSKTIPTHTPSADSFHFRSDGIMFALHHVILRC